MKELEQVIERLKALRASEKLPEPTIERVVIESCIDDLEAVSQYISNLEGQLDEVDKYACELQEQIEQMMPI